MVERKPSGVMVQQVLQELVTWGKRTGTVQERDLKAVLSGVEPDEEKWEALIQRFSQQLQLRVVSEEEGESLLYPDLEALRRDFAREAPALEYLAELKKLGVDRNLTAREEAALAARCREDTAAADALVNGNLLRVASIARQYRGQGMILLDLLSEGNRGLRKAVEIFDPQAGISFGFLSVYSIHREIWMALLRCSSRTVAAEERKVRQLVKELMKPELPQDMVISDPAPETSQWEDWLQELSGREAEILRLRLGLTDGQRHSRQEVAQLFGITPERVRQIENKAIRRTHVRKRKKIRDFYC